MNEFVVQQIHTDGYNRFVLCLTFESLFDYLDKIESSPIMINSSGTVLIDQLLITGNGHNRFLSCCYENGKLNFSSARNVEPGKEMRALTVGLLRENYECVKYSILTEQERECILENKAF